MAPEVRLLKFKLLINSFLLNSHQPKSSILFVKTFQVIMNSNGYSLSVDIWSLGCTILEMATAKPPWSQYEGVSC